MGRKGNRGWEEDHRRGFKGPTFFVAVVAVVTVV